MRFFSNEAQDNVDDKKDRHDDPDATAPVPTQRPGSPWQHDTDATPQNTAAGKSTTDDADRTVAFSDGVTRDRDEDADQAPKHTLPDDTTPKHQLPDDSFPASGDDKIKDDKIATDRTDDGVRTDDAAVDSALDDRGTFDDPHLTDTGPDADRMGSAPEDTRPGFPKTEPEQSKDEADVLDETDPTPDPVVTPVTEPAVTPVAETPAASGPLPFFPAADTQPLRDRWRDVQLRFVDDPKGATADAAGLVDEAVDKLSTALRDHKGSFAKGTDDTEALRVELRSYRDILDRLLGL